MSRWVRDLNPCRRICSPLPRLSANPPWMGLRDPLRADDEARTRDLNLGKVALYQLSYVRLLPVPGRSRAANVRTVADAFRGQNSPRRVSGPVATCGRLLEWAHARVGQRPAARDPTRPAVAVTDHGLTVGRRGLRGDQGGRRPAVRADPAPRAAGPFGARPGAAGAPTWTPYAAGVAAVLERPGAAPRPAPDHLHRRARAAGLRPGRRAADAGGRRRADGPGPETTAVATVPWPRNERGALAGLKTTSYAENVVALAEAPSVGRDRGGVRQPRRAPVRGHRLQRLLRRRRRAAHAVAGQRLPGRGHPGLVLEWYGGREVDEPIETRGRASEVFLVSTTRDVQARGRWDDVELPAPGPVTRKVAELGASASRSCWDWTDGDGRAAAKSPGVRTPRALIAPHRRSAGTARAIGAVVARFVHTEEVTGSNPVSPTSFTAGQRPPRGPLSFPDCRRRPPVRFILCG